MQVWRRHVSTPTEWEPISHVSTSIFKRLGGWSRGLGSTGSGGEAPYPVRLHYLGKGEQPCPLPCPCHTHQILSWASLGMFSPDISVKYPWTTKWILKNQLQVSTWMSQDFLNSLQPKQNRRTFDYWDWHGIEADRELQVTMIQA
jgi:hypothetical protein